LAYIGNIPAESYASFETETFSVSATTNYTLSHAVTNENEIRLVINGVVQQPGSGKAYTASGTTLTLTSATVSGDSMYAVYLGRALQTVNPANASVGAAQLASDAVTTAKILDANITAAKLASGVLPTNTPAFLAYVSSNTQTIASNTTVKITNYNAEVFDTDNGFASGQYTIPSGGAGKYVFHANVSSDTATAVTNKQFNLQIKVGSTTISSNTILRPPYAQFGISAMADVSVGNVVSMHMYQDSGSTVNLEGNRRTFFGGFKLIT